MIALEFILLHELAHLQRKDWLINLLVHAIGIPFFFHPLFYLVRKRLADVQEQICDGWVIQATGQRADYAQCLVDMLDQSVHRTKLALALGHQRSQLKNRVKAILDDGFPLNLHLKTKDQHTHRWTYAPADIALEHGTDYAATHGCPVVC